MLFPLPLAKRIRDEYPIRTDIHEALDGNSVLNVILMVVDENTKFIAESKAAGERRISGTLLRRAELMQDIYFLLERQKT